MSFSPSYSKRVALSRSSVSVILVVWLFLAAMVLPRVGKILDTEANSVLSQSLPQCLRSQLEVFQLLIPGLC